MEKSNVIKFGILVCLVLSIGLVLGVDCTKVSNHPSCSIKKTLETTTPPTAAQWNDFVNGKVDNKPIDVADELSKMVIDGTITAEKSKNLAELLAGKGKDGSGDVITLTSEQMSAVMKGLGKAYVDAGTGAGANTDKEIAKNLANSIMSDYLKSKGNEDAKFDFGSYKDETGLEIVAANDDTGVPETLKFGSGDNVATFAVTGLSDGAELSLEGEGANMYAVTALSEGGKTFKSRNKGDDYTQALVTADLNQLSKDVKDGIEEGGLEYMKVENVDGKEGGFVAVGFSKNSDRGDEGEVTIDGKRITTSGIAKTKVVNDVENSFGLSAGKSEKELIAELGTSDDKLKLISGGSEGKPAEVTMTVGGLSVPVGYTAGDDDGGMTLSMSKVSNEDDSTIMLGMEKDNDGNVIISGDMSGFKGEVRVGEGKNADGKVAKTKGSLQVGDTEYSADTTLSDKDAEGKSVIWTGEEGNRFFEINNGKVNVPSTLGRTGATAGAGAVGGVESSVFTAVTEDFNGEPVGNVFQRTITMMDVNGKKVEIPEYVTTDGQGNYYSYGNVPPVVGSNEGANGIVYDAQGNGVSAGVGPGVCGSGGCGSAGSRVNGREVVFPILGAPFRAIGALWRNRPGIIFPGDGSGVLGIRGRMRTRIQEGRGILGIRGFFRNGGFFRR